MSEEPKLDSTSGPRTWYRFIIGHRAGLILASATIAALCTVLVLWLSSTGDLPTIVGLFATIWALVLAIAIYLATSLDRNAGVQFTRALEEQLSELLSDSGSDGFTVVNRDATSDQFADYVRALRQEYPSIPIDDIVSTERPGSGPGNRPVIIRTRHNRRYSVWRGAAGGKFFVSKLPSTDED